MDFVFEWDETKNEAYFAKYGVDFEIAETVFRDENAKIRYDGNRSDIEDGFVIVGRSRSSETLTVHCCRQSETVIRLISARYASNNAEYNDEYFAKAIPNPYHKLLCEKVTITVWKKTLRIYQEIADKNGESVEDVMNRCIEHFGKVLEEAD